LPLFALDRIWVLPREALLEVRAHTTDLTRIASDHLPVRAVVDLDAEVWTQPCSRHAP
jgi:endonuclease/exonuclease/phosphatase family metal-dependent hydrolase